MSTSDHTPDHSSPPPGTARDGDVPAEQTAHEAEASTTDAAQPGPNQTDGEPTGPGPISKPSQGWGRLARMGRPRITKANLLATVLALLLGFGMVTQVQQYRASGLENMRQEDLVTLLDGVNQQGNRLGLEIDRLTRTRDTLRAGGGDAAAIKAAEERLAGLGILAGTVPATGPGIELTIKDPSSKLGANNVLDTVQELRDAGAEAIQIGDVRVTASSWFGNTAAGKLIVDGKELSGPYTVLAIGDSHTMSTALAIPGGVLETLRQLGISPSVVSKKVIDVTALRSTNTPSYAQPDTSQQ